MNKLVRLTAGACLIALSQGVFAAETLWDFRTGSVGNITNSSSNYGNTFSMYDATSGLSVEISAWSDTREYSNGASLAEDYVQNATLDNNSYGLIAYNRNSSDIHYIDNRQDKDDTDMILFKFSDAVKLSTLFLSSKYGDSDVSIAAFNVLPSFTGGRSWSDILNDSVNGAVFSASYADLATSSSLAGTSAITSTSSGANVLPGALVEAKYWLVGAYKSIFSADGFFGSPFGEGNDGFKLAGLTTTKTETTTTVSEPGTIGVMLLSLVLLGMRRLRK